MVLIHACWAWTIWWLGPAQYAIRSVCFWAAAGMVPKARTAPAASSNDVVFRIIVLPPWSLPCAGRASARHLKL